MDDFVKLWSHFVALFVESCFYLLPFLLSFVFIFCPLLSVVFFVVHFVEYPFYLLPFLLSVVCRWDWFHLFAVHHLPSTVRDYFHTGCVSFLALFLCISVFLVVYISRHDWFHQQVVQPQIDRLETIQLLEYQSQLHRCSCLYKSNGNLDLGLMPLVITMSRGAILSAVFSPPAHLCSSWFDCCWFVVFYSGIHQFIDSWIFTTLKTTPTVMAFWCLCYHWWLETISKIEYRRCSRKMPSRACLAALAQ